MRHSGNVSNILTSFCSHRYLQGKPLVGRKLTRYKARNNYVAGAYSST